MNVVRFAEIDGISEIVESFIVYLVSLNHSVYHVSCRAPDVYFRLVRIFDFFQTIRFRLSVRQRLRNAQ